MCGLTGGGGGLWLGLADHLARVSDTRVCLAGRSLQLCKAPVEAVEISDDCLPCCQAIGESNLSRNLLQNQIGETRMYISLSVASLKPVLPVSISNRAV